MVKRRIDGSAIEVEYKRSALSGNGGVSIFIEALSLRLTVDLEDAETLGEALVACVRAAEALTDPSGEK